MHFTMFSFDKISLKKKIVHKGNRILANKRSINSKTKIVIANLIFFQLR